MHPPIMQVSVDISSSARASKPGPLHASELNVLTLVHPLKAAVPLAAPALAPATTTASVADGCPWRRRAHGSCLWRHRQGTSIMSMCSMSRARWGFWWRNSSPNDAIVNAAKETQRRRPRRIRRRRLAPRGVQDLREWSFKVSGQKSESIVMA